MMKTKAYILLSLAFIVILTACEKSAIPDRQMIADGAKICFFNLSADVTTTGTVMTNELCLYFNDIKVTALTSTAVNRLRGIPYRSSYPGVVVAAPAATTAPSSYVGAEYFNAAPGAINIVAKDTAYNTGQFTFPTFTTTFTFEKDKYYSIFAMDLRPTMVPVIVEDAIVPFKTLKKVKVRCVNGIYGVVGNVDVWLIHQAATAEYGRAPFKLASGLEYKNVTAFSDTITSGSYRYIVVNAGTVPTAITNPGPVLGQSYTMTFPAGTTIVALSSATTFSERTTYSILMYGQNTKTGIIAPYASLFRNRLL